MLQLRLASGVDFEHVRESTGIDARTVYSEHLERLQKLGLIDVGGHGFALTERGIDVADAVAGEFLL